MDIITALESDPMDANKVHVFIDGKHAFVLAIDVVASELLYTGQSCPPDKVQRLQNLQAQQQTYEAALVFLSYRPRSTREVEQRLRKKGHEPEQIEATIARLRKIGLIDDSAFSRSWINNRQTISPRGPSLLRSELRQKGVPKEIVDNAMSEYQEKQAEQVEESNQVAADHGITYDEPPPGSDEASALMLARKRMRILSNYDPIIQKRRLTAFLARRGYNYSTIGPVLQRVLKPAAPEEDEEEGGYELFDGD
ncbi:MAG: RecX family transcriptional regulator [Chloroflexia bacterium]